MPKLEFDLDALNRYRSADPNLQAKADAIEQEIYSLRARFKAVREQQTKEEIEAVSAEREQAAATARAIQDKQRKHRYQQGEIIGFLNLWAERRAERQGEWQALHFSPVNPDVSSDAEIKDYNDKLDRAVTAHNKACSEHTNAYQRLQVWEWDAKDLERQFREATEKTRDVQRRLDALTGKQPIRSSVSVVRTDGATGLPAA